MRLLLTVETGPLAGRSLALESGSVELGRDSSCGLCFDDHSVSRRHATVVLEDQGCRLIDHSSNGTLVNGRRVDTSSILRAGDIVRLGPAGPSLRVEIGSAEVGTHIPPVAGVARTTRVEASLYYDPSSDKGQRHGAAGMALVLGMALGGCFFGLLTALLTFFELGVGAALVGVVVAFLPAPVYLAIWLWLDRYDPEPAWILAGAFVWGAGAATFVAGVVNSVFEATVMALTRHEAISELLSASISAPIAEEFLKGIAVLAIFLLFRREFDGVVDGVVYAGVVALGFATVENVLYYGKAMASKGPALLALVFILRGVLGPFSHALFTSMTGIGCGVARQTHRGAVRVVMPVLGFGAAVSLHGLWNTLAAVSGSLAGHLLVYCLVWAPLFLAFFAVVIFLGHRESQLIHRMLESEVTRGLLRREHLLITGSWLRRMAWLLSDLGRLQPRRRFLHAATRLAFCYWHASRAAAAGGHTVSFSQIAVFQREIQALLPRI